MEIKPLIEQIFTLVLMALTGFAAGRTGLINENGNKAVSTIALYISLPCAMVTSLQRPFNPQTAKALLLSLSAAVVIHLIFFGASILLGYGRHGITKGEQLSVLFNNAGNVVIPLVIGAMGEAYVLYAAPYMLVQNILLWSYGLMVITGDRSKAKPGNIIKTPAVIGVLIGLVLFLSRITLPGILGGAVSSMGSCLAPLCMLVIGGMLAATDLKATFRNHALYAVIFLRLIVFPLMAVACLWMIKAFIHRGNMTEILIVSLLCSIGPCSASIPQLFQLHNHPEQGYVSAVTAVSTIFSVVTIPVIIALFMALP